MHPLLVFKFIVNADGSLGILIEKPDPSIDDAAIKAAAHGLFQLHGGKVIEATGNAIMAWGNKTGHDLLAMKLINEWKQLIINDRANGPVVSPRAVFNA